MVARIVLAKIISTHGIRGLLKLELYNSKEQNFFSYENNFKIDNKRVAVTKKFKKGNYLICRIDDIQNISEASLLLEKEIWIYESELKKINKSNREKCKV